MLTLRRVNRRQLQRGCHYGISRCAVLLSLFLAGWYYGSPTYAAPLASKALWLGTNRVVFGGVTAFQAPASAKSFAEAQRMGKSVRAVRGAIVVPVDFELSKPRHILVVSVPSGGSSVKALGYYTNAAL